MANLVFGMNQSLDGYVDHMAFGPSPELFQHFIAQARALTGSLYGRGLYEIMRYWDEDKADWGAPEHDYAAAWRAQPKWVVSRTLGTVGPNATLIKGDLAQAIHDLKTSQDGEIEVGGPCLARSLGALGLIDMYRIYLHPVVLGGGTPFFVEARPRLRFVASERVDKDVVRLIYRPA